MILPTGGPVRVAGGGACRRRSNGRTLGGWSGHFAIDTVDAPGECLPGAAATRESRLSIHSLGTPYTPTELYAGEQAPEGEPARCLPIEQVLFETPAELAERYDFRDLGPEVPPNTFVAASVGTL